MQPTMSLRSLPHLSRKRSARSVSSSEAEPDHDDKPAETEGYFQFSPRPSDSQVAPPAGQGTSRRSRSPSKPPATPREAPKRSRTDGDIDGLELVPKEDAWGIDVSTLVGSQVYLRTPEGGASTSDGGVWRGNWERFEQGRSPFLLAVMGGLDVQYDVLREAIPSLLTISPMLQPLVVHHSLPPTFSALSPPTLSHFSSSHAPSCPLISCPPPSLPLIVSPQPPSSLFLSLGLLHPLGGGLVPLDAIVLLDGQGRRRLVVPFGWGAGRHVLDGAGGKLVRERLTGVLVEAVKALERERTEEMEQSGVDPSADVWMEIG
ncbi:hypothetical protein BDY21DRAFT_351928 [Lineolata rhizophorae]|uniref:Uncharacterized protein n=1 Tax=Lineolata rhizophorae TaxID=578093 RepID=A0A6A6NU13_9PEZI|nr:hypothetical protein BDY21DRAFT_351928 [Lineolata rhizophorae]